MTDYIKLPVFMAGRPVIDPKTGAPTTEFLAWLNNNWRNITVSINAIASAQADIEASLTMAGIALTTVEAVQADLDAAQSEANLVNSYTDPQGGLLTASDAGSDATITVADHDRVYADGTRVAVTGGSVTGLAYSTTYFIYYNDPDYAGGAVTYLHSPNPNDAVQGGGVHSLGAITTPASGGGINTGGGTTGSGVPNCVADDTPILLANAALDGPGEEIAARHLRVGDHLWTRHHRTGEWGAYPVEAISFAREPVFLCFEEGWREPIGATALHRFQTMTQGPICWTHAGTIGVENGSARVARITVRDAHTYVSAGVLSHNIKSGWTSV